VPNGGRAMDNWRGTGKVLSLLAAGSMLVLTATVCQATDTSFDRRAYYSQPMGYSVWKRPPGSVDEFVTLLESNRLNATSAQYAQALHEAGWVPTADVGAAVTFLRTLKQAEATETKQYRMGRILRSYKTGKGGLDANFVQVMKAGEFGYFDSTGRLVIRVLCLNVIYPDRRVAVLPASEERLSPVAPEVPPRALPLVERPPEPPSFSPPPPEKPEPVSRSLP